VAESEPGAHASLSNYAARVDLGPSVPLKQAQSQLEEELESANYGPATLLSQGNLSTAVRTSIALKPAPGCQRVDVVGGTPLSGVRGWAYDASGALMGAARGAGRLSLLLCGTAPSRLDLEAALSPGPFVALSRNDPDAPAAMQKHPLAASRLMAAAWSSGAANQPRDIGGTTEVAVDVARLGRADLRVPVRRCMDVFAALGAGARGLEMRVVDSGSGIELGRSHGAHAATTRLCATKGTISARVELSTESGSATALFATRMSVLGP
jgi:hypothetical protein